MRLGLSRIIGALFRPKSQEPEKSEINELVDELVAIGKASQAEEVPFPTVQYECSKCHSRWFCFGYSREFTPIYCTYCGVKVGRPPESELAKANFLYEKKDTAK